MTKTIYAEAGLFKRFFAYLIDVFIIVAFLTLVTIVLDKTIYSNVSIPAELEELISDPDFTLSALIELCETNLECNKYFNSMMVGMIIISIIGIIFIFIYFVVIPYKFKNFQTLGRYATNLRVVDEEFYLPNFKKCFLRDFVGFIVMFLLNLIGIGMIINLTFLLLKNRTIGDMLAKTKLINLNYYREVTIEDKKEEESEFVEVIDDINQ